MVVVLFCIVLINLVEEVIVMFIVVGVVMSF